MTESSNGAMHSFRYKGGRYVLGFFESILFPLSVSPCLCGDLGGWLSDFLSSFQSAKAAPEPSKISEAFLALLLTFTVSEAMAGRTQRLNGK